MTTRGRTLLVGALASLALAPAMEGQNRPTPARPKPQRPVEVPPAVVVLQIDTTEGDSTRTIIQRDLDYGDRVHPLILDSLTMAEIWKHLEIICRESERLNLPENCRYHRGREYHRTRRGTTCPGG